MAIDLRPISHPVATALGTFLSMLRLAMPQQDFRWVDQHWPQRCNLPALKSTRTLSVEWLACCTPLASISMRRYASFDSQPAQKKLEISRQLPTCTRIISDSHISKRYDNATKLSNTTQCHCQSRQCKTEEPEQSPFLNSCRPPPAGPGISRLGFQGNKTQRMMMDSSRAHQIPTIR